MAYLQAITQQIPYTSFQSWLKMDVFFGMSLAIMIVDILLSQKVSAYSSGIVRYAVSPAMHYAGHLAEQTKAPPGAFCDILFSMR